MPAVAEKGCIVLGEIPTKLGLMVTFKKKCEKCNYKEAAASGGVIDPVTKEYKTGFHCIYCGNDQLVIIKEV